MNGRFSLKDFLVFALLVALGIGLLLAPVIIVMKFVFIGMFMGMVFRGFGKWRHPHHRSDDGQAWHGEEWRSSLRRRQPEPSKSDRERFQEWHDLEHARREVDSWTTYDL